METDIQIRLNLSFPRAGVVFAIEVDEGEGGGDAVTPAFRLTVEDAASGRRVPFTVDSSPELADWVRGYTRWLGRARVSASHDDDSIRGTFPEGLTPEQVLEGVRSACEMIRQRFDLYREPVVG